MRETEGKTEKEPKGRRFAQSLTGFLTDLDCLKDLYSQVVPLLDEADKRRREVADALFEKHAQPDPDDPKKRIARLPTEENKIFFETIQKHQRAALMFKRNILVSITSRYEEFLSEQIHGIFQLFPEKFANSEKSIVYKEICHLSEGVTPLELIISKEVDEIMRLSAEDQLRYLDKEFKLGLFDGFTEIIFCIESCERRNLCAHTGGVISKQYLEKCQKINYKWKSGKEPEVGRRVSVGEDYFKRALDSFFLLGLRISQGLMRRFAPDEKEYADEHLVNIGFKRLEQESYPLAEKVFDFALSIPDKHISQDQFKKMFIINKCIALYHQDRKQEMESLLSGIDWSAMHPKFVLAVSVLRDDLAKSIELMKKSDLSPKSFSEWPLFRKVRSTEEFKAEYKRLFGTELAFESTAKDEDAKIAPNTAPQNPLSAPPSSV